MKRETYQRRNRAILIWKNVRNKEWYTYTYDIHKCVLIIEKVRGRKRWKHTVKYGDVTFYFDENSVSLSFFLSLSCATYLHVLLFFTSHLRFFEIGANTILFNVQSIICAATVIRTGRSVNSTLFILSNIIFSIILSLSQ